MALRLGKLCGKGPELWLALQTRYDLDRLRHEKAAEIDAIATLEAAQQGRDRATPDRAASHCAFPSNTSRRATRRR
jgi:plasmid maintenance system antidote protein VapI